jgi:hypothetical protein
MPPVERASPSTGVRSTQVHSPRDETATPTAPAGGPTVREDTRMPPGRRSAELARQSEGAAGGSSRRSAVSQAPRASGDEVRLQIGDLARSTRFGSETSNPLRASLHEDGDDARLVVPGTPEIGRDDSMSTASCATGMGEVRLDVIDTAAAGPAHRPLHPGPRGATQAAEIADATSRREYTTALSTTARTPGVTGLQAFARVSSDLAVRGGQPPHGPQPSRFNAVTSAVKRAVGLQDNLTWMATKMRVVRADAFEAKAPAGTAQPTNALRLLRTDQPVSAVWRGPTLASGHHFGVEADAILARMDQLAATHTPELALAVSFACRSAGAAHPEHEGSLEQALDLLQGTDGAALRTLLAQDPADGEPPAPALQLARKILESCCDNNRFEAMAQALAPALDEAAVPVLRRMLQAGKAHAATPASDSLAARVHQAATAELADAAAPLAPVQRVEGFLWDNGFHDDGPKSALSELKQHFFAGLEELAKPAHQAGPVRAAATYGLGGANLHLLADEQAKLLALLRTPEQTATPELRTLTDALSNRVIEGLNAAQARLRQGSTEPDDDELDEIVELVALAVALKRWSGDAVANLSPADVVHGPAQDVLPHSPEAAEIVATCTRLMAGDSPLRSLDDLGVEDRTADLEPSRRSLALAHALGGMVSDHLQSNRLGLHGLLDFARRAEVPLPVETAAALQRGLGIIQAESIHPEAATAEATGEAMARFLGNVQFGNHSRLSSIDTQGYSTRGTGANLTALEHPGDAHAAHKPVVVRGELAADRTVESFVRAGAATHGGEFILGRDARAHAHLGAGGQAGRQWGATHSVHARVMAGADSTVYSLDSSRYEGAMFRVDRRVTTDVPDAVAPQFGQSDARVRDTMAGMARELFGNGPQHAAPQERDQYFQDFVHRFMDHDLSLTLMQQDSTTHRSDLALSVGGSIATPLTKKHGFGTRVGTSGSVGVEKGWSFALSEKDRTGSYRINNVRSGWFTRTKASVNVAGVNPILEKAYGLPATSVAGVAANLPDGGGSVRVRVPTRDGNIVPEKTFSDTETPDKEFFKDVVLADKQKWIDLFAYKYRHEGAEQSRQRGEADVDAFFYKADHVHDANHLYYARERMHPDVAQRLDELAGIEHQIPHDDPAFAGLRAEIAGQRERLASDDRSWNAASLIAYQREVKQDGSGVNAAGARAMRSTAVEGEREFIFDTIGWANLRQRERDNPPTHLDE